MSLANPSKVLLLSRTTTPVAITAYAGNPLELTLVFSAGGTSNVFTGIDTLRLEIHADNLISPARVPLALLEWTSPTGAALTQTLTSAQLNLLGSSLDSKKFYLVVYAITGSSVEVYQMATLTLQSHPAALLADPPPAVGSAVALTLAQGNILYGADTGVTAGTYGSATLAPILTVNAKGKITAASTAAITASTAATLATARTLAITGDLAWTSPAFNGSANVTAAGTLASTGVTAGTYGSASVAPIITVDAKGRITSASTATIAASTAATLATARTINGVSFNGSANITVPVVPVVYDLYGTIDDTIASTATVARLTTALTANRIFTLPSPLNYPAGSPLTFVDATGTVGLTYNVTLYAGSNTVNGASSMVLSTPYASPVLISNGSNAWTLDVRGVSRGGTGATTAAGARTNLGAAASGANSDITSASALTSAAGGTFGTGAFNALVTRATLGLATTDSPTFNAITSTAGSVSSASSMFLIGGANVSTFICSNGYSNLFQLGGFTSSYPALRQSGTEINVVYADVSSGYTSMRASQFKTVRTDIASGTTGAQTINRGAGSVNFAAAATSLVITNSLVTTATRVIATVNTNDSTCYAVQAVCSAGSITLYAKPAAPTAEMNVSWIICNS